MKRGGTTAILAGALLFAASAAPAVQPDEVLPDPALEARARHISADVRCVVCQNQTIDDSDAPLARDLRLLVRERLRAGESDGAVRDFIVARYGDFVLLKPPFRLGTWILWFGPFAILLVGGAALLSRRRVADADVSPLSAGEAERLAGLVDQAPPRSERP